MLVTEVKSKNIAAYAADCLILPTPFSLTAFVSFSVAEIKAIAAQKPVILKMDRLLDETELSALKEYIASVKDIPVRFYLFTDFAVYMVLKKFTLEKKSLYFAKTYLTSAQEVASYNSLGISCLIATEISFPELQKIAALKGNFIYTFGYAEVFYAKRKLLSLYNKHAKKKLFAAQRPYFLKERTRSDKYLIYESPCGTVIYLPDVYYLWEELKSLAKDNYFYIDGTMINDAILIKVLHIYQEVFRDPKAISAASPLFKLGLPLKKGFLDFAGDE